MRHPPISVCSWASYSRSDSVDRKGNDAMKLTICLLAGIAALCIASAYARQQAPPFNESLAYARLLRAHKLPSVTHGQCVSAQNDWLEKDKADKQDGPYWYQKISTEDLVQLTSLSTPCATQATARQATSIR